MTKRDLENILVRLWGSTVKPFNTQPNSRLAENIDLESLTDKNLIYILDVLLKSSSSSMYVFSVDYDNYDIFRIIKSRLYAIKSNSRRIKPILRCYDILESNPRTQEGLFAIATIYLVSEIENLLKSQCLYINQDGIIKKEIPKTLRRKISSPQFKIGKRINQIGDVIKLYCYRNNSPFAYYLKNLDKEIIAFNKVRLKGHFNIENGNKMQAKYHHIKIVDRVNQIRNLMMHGNMPYLDTEIFFYLTLHSIFFLEHKKIYDEY